MFTLLCVFLGLLLLVLCCLLNGLARKEISRYDHDTWSFTDSSLWVHVLQCFGNKLHYSRGAVEAI